jgi:hypothetical protein
MDGIPDRHARQLSWIERSPSLVERSVCVAGHNDRVTGLHRAKPTQTRHAGLIIDAPQHSNRNSASLIENAGCAIYRKLGLLRRRYKTCFASSVTRKITEGTWQFQDSRVE